MLSLGVDGRGEPIGNLPQWVRTTSLHVTKVLDGEEDPRKAEQTRNILPGTQSHSARNHSGPSAPFTEYESGGRRLGRMKNVVVPDSNQPHR